MAPEVVNTDLVIEHLSVTVETESALADAFESAALVTSERKARLKLEEYRTVTLRHWDLATVFIARYGSLPQPKETLESIVKSVESSLAGGPQKLRQLHRLLELSGLLLLSRSNWEVFRLIASASGEESLASQAGEVVRVKNEHLLWLREYVKSTGPKVLFSRRLSVARGRHVA